MSIIRIGIVFINIDWRHCDYLYNNSNKESI